MESWIEYTDNEVSINLGELIKLLLKKIKWIIGATAIGGIVFLLYAMLLITPLYRSSILMYVNNRAANSEIAGISSSDITAAQHLVETYSIVLTSAKTMNAVIEQTGVDYTKKQLTGMISTSAVDETEIVRVTVTSPDPEEAATIANAIADIAPDNIMDIITGSSVKIVEYASVPTSKSSPNIPKYAVFGALLGFLLSCGVIALRSALGNGLTVEDKIRREFKDNAILASIPELLTEAKKKEGLEDYLVCDNLDFHGTEAYRLLRTNITFSFPDEKKCHVIGVTSSTRGEGKSTTAINMAYTLAQAGNKVCLIDGDLRLPTINERLILRKTPGLVNFLVGQASGQDILQQYSGNRGNMYVIVAGDVPPNPSELLTSTRMKSLMDVLEKTFDYIILDLPPVGIVADALAVTKLLDGVVMVVREDFYERRMLKESLRLFQGVGARVLGLTITHSTAKQHGYHRYAKYGYGDDYSYGTIPYGYQGYEQTEKKDENGNNN